MYCLDCYSGRVILTAVDRNKGLGCSVKKMDAFRGRAAAVAMTRSESVNARCSFSAWAHSPSSSQGFMQAQPEVRLVPETVLRA